MQIKEFQEHLWVEFDNSVSVEICTEGDSCGGIGRVKCGRTDIRDDELPVFPLVSTAEGYQVSCLEVDEIEENDDESVVITYRPYINTCGHRDPASEEGGLWNVTEWNCSPERDRGGELTLELAEVNRTLGGRELRGFSYAYKFRSRKYRPVCIHDRGTWEIGGSGTRNNLVVPGRTASPLKQIQNKKDEFTSSSAGDGGSEGAQMKPLVSEMQGFTYQFDRHNALVGTFDGENNCRTVIQKDSGRNYIVHWHQLTGESSPNGGSLETSPHRVMCLDEEIEDDAEGLNTYADIKRDLNEQFREERDISLEPVNVSGFLKEGIWHRGDEVQRGIKQLADAGCEEIIIPDLMHGDVVASQYYHDNSLSEKVSRTVPEAAEVIRKLGMEVGMMVNLASILKEWDEDQPLPERDDMEDLVDGTLSDAQVDALYLLGNPSQLPPSLAESASPDVVLDLKIAFMQALESMGVRGGCDGCGPMGLLLPEMQFSGVNGNEILYENTIAEFPYVEVIEEDKPGMAYFRGYSCRLCYGIPFGANDGERPTLPEWYEAEFAEINTAFAGVKEHMQYPRLLPDDRGIMWRSSREEDAVRVLWSYDELMLEAGEEAEIFDVRGASPVSVPEDGQIEIEEKCIYMLQGDVGVQH
ncbi:MAG: hypothetical protein ACOC2T_02950 [Planctomycetota bacterium]